jgi:hypothetical protein
MRSGSSLVSRIKDEVSVCEEAGWHSPHAHNLHMMLLANCRLVWSPRYAPALDMRCRSGKSVYKPHTALVRSPVNSANCHEVLGPVPERRASLLAQAGIRNDHVVLAPL